ncbi:MAG TPA: transcriptional regulator [Thioalkalivibrio sp.]|nr:transcriptional regulator [Thioalkalivibrio sp.]
MRLVVLIFALFPALAFATDDARQWLDRMSHAVQSLSYEGTFVYSHDGRMETMQIVHALGPDGPRERLVSLSGEAREMIRDHGVLTCIWPGSRSVVVEPARSSKGLARPMQGQGAPIEDNYALSVSDRKRVAGLDCRLVEVRPRDAYRFGYRLCIAEDNAMLLKSTMLDEAGKPIEQLMFTSIAFDEVIAPERFNSPQVEATPRPEPVSGNHPVDQGWQFSSLPPGFALQSVVSRPMHEGGEPVQQMIISDGLASVSVFIADPKADDQYYQGVTGTGALHAFARVVDGRQVTVVGEVPEVTVRLIGDALVYEEH